MADILILMDHEENRRLLAAALRPVHSVAMGCGVTDLGGRFDLAMVDGLWLRRLRPDIAARRTLEEPVFLPFLLVSSQHDLSVADYDLWQVVDDVLAVPVRRMELQARVEVLLKARRYSAELRRSNDDIQALVYALGHDLRAPARVTLGFARALAEDYGDLLPDEARHYLARIKAGTSQVHELLELLVGYVELGRRRIAFCPLPVAEAVRDTLDSLEEPIAAAGAEIVVQDPLPQIMGDPVLLNVVLSNLVTNAIKFVAPGMRPRVEISVEVTDSRAILRVADNGVGVPVEAQERIFRPFVRLHGEEAYAGTGLGLAVVQRATRLMGGDVGLESVPGGGSTFWVELKVAGGGDDAVPDCRR